MCVHGSGHLAGKKKRFIAFIRFSKGFLILKMSRTAALALSPWTLGSFPCVGLGVGWWEGMDCCVVGQLCWNLLPHTELTSVSSETTTLVLVLPSGATLGKANPSFIFLKGNSFLSVLNLFPDMNLVVKGNPWHFWCLQSFSWSQQVFSHFEKFVSLTTWSLKVMDPITWTPCTPMRLNFVKILNRGYRVLSSLTVWQIMSNDSSKGSDFPDKQL